MCKQYFANLDFGLSSLWIAQGHFYKVRRWLSCRLLMSWCGVFHTELHHVLDARVRINITGYETTHIYMYIY